MKETKKMDLKDFCNALAQLEGFDSTKTGLSILWWHDQKQTGIEMTGGELARIIRQHGLGNPNSTILENNIRSTRLVLKGNNGFRLKAKAKEKIQQWLGDMVKGEPPEINHERGYLPEAVWKNTRGYIEKVCYQLNGCYIYHFWDAAAVMIRRLAETLIIEAYEHLGRQSEIQGNDRNYLQLGELINATINEGGLSLGREAKKALGLMKKQGDRSAHNRRYNAVKHDLDKLHDGVRVVVDELINIADVRTRTE